MGNISAKERVGKLILQIYEEIALGSRDPEKTANDLQRILEKKGIVTAFDPEGFFHESRIKAIKFYRKWGFDPSCLEKVTLSDEFRLKMMECYYRFGFDFLSFTLPISPASYIFKGGDPANKPLPFVIYPDSDKKEPFCINSDITKSDYFRQPNPYPEVFFMKIKPGCDRGVDGIAGTIKLTYPEVINLEEKYGLGGMDLQKALIFHHYYYDKFGNHLHIWRDRQAIWLTETKDRIIAGQCADFSWGPGDRQFNVDLWDRTFARDSLGSVFSISSPLKVG